MPLPVAPRPNHTNTCAWDYPGANAYLGVVANGVERYADIAPSLRDKLRRRMDAHAYDDFVVIARNRITGRRRRGRAGRRRISLATLTLVARRRAPSTPPPPPLVIPAFAGMTAVQ